LGKTTLLNCLGAAIPGADRVVSCEEVFELRFAAQTRRYCTFLAALRPARITDCERIVGIR